MSRSLKQAYEERTDENLGADPSVVVTRKKGESNLRSSKRTELKKRLTSEEGTKGSAMATSGAAPDRRRKRGKGGGTGTVLNKYHSQQQENGTQREEAKKKTYWKERDLE